MKKRVLFVDDEPAILDGLRDVLFKERKQWEMVFVLGGEHALAELRKQPFDLVVSDMRMPGLDGAALLSAIKAEFPETSRIMLTGQADREALTRALPAVDELLTKPCEPASLRAAIARRLA